MREKLLKLFLKRSRSLVLLLFIAGGLLCFIPLKNFQEGLLKINSIEDARLYSQAISHFRTIYSREIIAKVQEHGMKVTHEYKGDKHAIPLPASFSMLLGEEIAKDRYGGQIQLYSPYPFSWRKQTGGLRDSFKQEAWQYFQKNPKGDYFRFQNVEGVTYLRYAVPDIMRESCVQCHNTHPESPKVGWKVGDVRGILEVKRPVNLVNQKSSLLFNERMVQLFFLVCLFLGVLYFVLASLRKKIILLDDQSTLIQAQQQQLIQSSKMSAIGEMAGGIAHEINNPLAAINLIVKGLKKNMNKENCDKKIMLKSLDDIESTVNRMNKIITGLRTISRNEPEGKPELVLLQSIFDDVLGLCSEKLKNSEIKFKIQDPSTILSTKVWCNQVQLSQVILNLIQNSLDAIKVLQDKWININLSIYHDILIIRVIDSGRGIDKKTAEKIFQPFYTTKGIGQGTGIGLSLSKSMIEKQYGRLYIDHTFAHTCFVIEIPQKRWNI